MSDLVDKAKNFVVEKIAEIPKPDARLEDVKVKGIARNGVTYHAMVGIKNPYPHSLPVYELVYTLKCGGQIGPSCITTGRSQAPSNVVEHFYAQIENRTPNLMVAGGTKTTLEMPMLVPHGVLVTLAKGVIKDWEIDYELDVGVVMDLPVVGSLTIPLHAKGDIKLPTLKELITSDK